MESLKKKIQEVINLYKLNKFAEAESFGKKLINQNPKVSYLYNLMGLIMYHQKKLEESLKFYQKGIEINPDYAMIYNNLGMLFETKNDFINAENYYKKSINLDSKLTEPQNNLGNLYLNENKHKEAIYCFKNSICNNPSFYVAHYNLAITYKTIGKFEQSRKHLKKAIKLNPEFYNAHRTLSQINKYKTKDRHFKLLKNLYLNQNIDEHGKIELAFALGKAYEDIKDFTNAFKHFREGNNIRRKNIQFTLKKEEEEFFNIKKLFNNNLFKKNKNNEHKTPIFILGMPRSGTTLIEQIISNHPKVFGGDELNIFNKLIKKYFYKNGFFISRNITSEDEENISKIGSEYIKEIQKISGKERITDKLPINFKWIGFIKYSLPNAKIIHCVRNSKDTCLSIYKNYFTNTELNYAYDLEELVGFYNLYIKMMNFWKSKYPNFIIEIKYEKLIKNPNDEIKNLIRSCDLPWNKNCIKFYNNKRPIKTASDSQARNKIYKTSLNSWKNYDKYLKKYFSKLII